MSAGPASPAAQERFFVGISHKEPVVDVRACPFGLPHTKGSVACKTFRRALSETGLRPPRSGWVCSAEATTTEAAGAPA